MRFMAWFSLVSITWAMVAMPITLVALLSSHDPMPSWFPPTMVLVEILGGPLIVAMLTVLRGEATARVYRDVTEDEGVSVSELSRRIKAQGGDPSAARR